MALSIYVVVFTRGSEIGIPLLSDKYEENAFKVRDDVMLVASNGLSSEIAANSSLTKDREDEGVRGAVFKLTGSYTGYANGSLWEWLENIEESE